MQYECASYSDIGGRETNEDAMFCERAENALAAAVADGLGGHGGGEIASGKALERFGANLQKLIPPTEAALSEVCADMNRAVIEAQTEKLHMKTTLAAAVLNEGTLACMHVGDSRVYYFKDGGIRYQSTDHSVSQLAVLAHEITQEQIRFHEDRSRILRSLGSEDAAVPEIRVFTDALMPGDAVLLCTDGFWEYVLEKEILSFLKRTRTAQDWLGRMVRILRKRAKKGNDNNSAVAIRVTAQGTQKARGF